MDPFTDLCLLEPLSLEGLVWCWVLILLTGSVSAWLLNLEPSLATQHPRWFASPFILPGSQFGWSGHPTCNQPLSFICICDSEQLLTIYSFILDP